MSVFGEMRVWSNLVCFLTSWKMTAKQMHAGLHGEIFPDNNDLMISFYLARPQKMTIPIAHIPLSPYSHKLTDWFPY